jgi:hypothetical protein
VGGVARVGCLGARCALGGGGLGGAPPRRRPRPPRPDGGQWGRSPRVRGAAARTGVATPPAHPRPEGRPVPSPPATQRACSRPAAGRRWCEGCTPGRGDRRAATAPRRTTNGAIPARYPRACGVPYAGEQQRRPPRALPARVRRRRWLPCFSGVARGGGCVWGSGACGGCVSRGFSARYPAGVPRRVGVACVAGAACTLGVSTKPRGRASANRGARICDE